MRELARRAPRWLIGSVLTIGALVGVVGFACWYLFVDETIQMSWTVVLPRGGSLAYVERAPREQLAPGPMGTRNSLIWTTPKGRTREYSLPSSGYDDLSVLESNDGRGVWVVSRKGKAVLAGFDLETNQFLLAHIVSPDRWSPQSSVFDMDGEPLGKTRDVPGWSRLQGGQVVPPTSSYSAP